MSRKYRAGLMLALTGICILVVSALLTLAIDQARNLISLYTVSVSPPRATGVRNLWRLNTRLSSDVLILAIVAALLFILVFRHPRRLGPVSIVAGLAFIVLNLFSGRHVLPQVLVWPMPLSISGQYVQALAANDLETALRLTDGSKGCETVVVQAFQEDQARLNMKATKAAITLALLLGCVLAGCSVDRWASVEPGDYAPVQSIGPSSEVAVQAIQTLRIDRDENAAIFTLADGSKLTASFVPRSSGEWPAGCPSNIHSTYMEVLDIEQEALTIGSLTFRDPILVRNCPPDPVRVALREDGEIGGGGSACTGSDKCFLFGISSVSAPANRVGIG